MKKGNLKSIVISGAVIISTVVLGIVVMTIKGAVGRDKSNLFAYAVDLENENWAYAPKGLDYGMTVEEVIKAERLKNYIWEVENEILRIEKTVKNRFSEVKELDYVKRYFFDSDGELASVRYELTFESDAEDYVRQLLYDQSLEYMPEESRKTDLEDLLGFEELLDFEYDILGPWNKVVVWEDTVYESTAEDSKVLMHANSDVVLRVSRPEYESGSDKTLEEQIAEKDIIVSLTIGRYEDRLSQAQIEALREDYPIINVDIWPSMAAITMEFCMWQAETFAYGIFMGEEVVFDDKGSYEHNAHKVEVIGDTEKKLSKKEEIVSTYDRRMMIFDKMPGEGKLEIVVPAYRYEGEWVFSTFGLFYVTEDGYVIANYDEDNWFGRVAESALSGLKLEDFLRKVKK